MTKNTAPYHHADGSNCWTKDCRLGNTATIFKSSEQEFIKSSLETFNRKNQPANIDVIATLEAFNEAVNQGRITGQYHPVYPYRIFKYSQITTYAKDWDAITLASRGLVVNTETGEIVVRPFKKFFNYNEGQTPDEVMSGPFTVADKLDGSLGLLFKNPSGGFEITTAGGFMSDQAAHATALYNEKYAGKWNPNDNLSYHFEIIYAQNRIVVNYGDEDDIYLLGAVNKKTGRSVPLSKLTEWKWKRAQEFDNFNSIADVTNAPDPGITKEGYIVHFTDTDARVKFKFGEYLQVHKLATGLNARRIHSELKAGGDTLENFKMNAPEEFKDYIEAQEKDIMGKYTFKKKQILDLYDEMNSMLLPEKNTQKDFALLVNQKAPKEFRSQLFSLRTRGTVNEESLWDSIEPPFEKGFWAAGTGKNETE